MQFRGKTVFITGANRGIGKALVNECLAKGAKKIYASSRNVENLPPFNDSRVVPIELDISDKNQINEAAQRCQDTQILINNAGTLNPGSILP